MNLSYKFNRGGGMYNTITIKQLNSLILNSFYTNNYFQLQSKQNLIQNDKINVLKISICIAGISTHIKYINEIIHYYYMNNISHIYLGLNTQNFKLETQFRKKLKYYYDKKFISIFNVQTAQITYKKGKIVWYNICTYNAKLYDTHLIVIDIDEIIVMSLKNN